AAGEHGALVVETRHQDVYPAARLREYVFLRHFAVPEHELAGVRAAHAQLVELLRGGKSLEAFFDYEGGDSAWTGVCVGLGVDHEHVRVRAVGDPHLAAVQGGAALS